MRSGPIQPEQAQESVNRGAETLALWEGGAGGPAELPWPAAATFEPSEVQRWVQGARTLALVVGAGTFSRTLLDAVLGHVKAPARLYVYGDRVLESDTALVRRLSQLCDRVLVRLGHRPPADWLVADQGRDGRLVLGPDAASRSWIVPVDGPLARSLFEAFRHLFWFQAAREALPDGSGVVAFRAPLAAPFDPPGDDVPLPSGRLRLDGRTDDPVPDAEIRVSPALLDPGRARVVFVPPSEGMVNGSPMAAIALEVPRAIAQRGARTVWADLGLPSTTVTRQRFVLDLVESPIALQLEWPRAAAVDLFHRLERAAAQPAWEFHPSRQLRAIRGKVLLDGGSAATSVQRHVALDAGEVIAPLTAFDSARPRRLPEPPALALQVVYQWRRIPNPLPAGSRTAAFVRAWTAADEWAGRVVDDCRAALDRLDQQEGLLGRLRRWLPSRDEALLERRRLRDEVDEIGESRPSQAPELAADRLRRLRDIAVRLDHISGTAHDVRQAAEDAAAEHAQREAWEARVTEAERKLEEVRARLAANRAAQERAQADADAAEKVVEEAVAAARAARTAELKDRRGPLQAELEAARTAQQDLDAQHNGRPPKPARKAAAKRVQAAEQALAQNRREQDAVSSWSPPPSMTRDEAELLGEVKATLARLRTEAAALSKEVGQLERASDEEFRFEPPGRLRRPASLEVPAPPPVPDEAPPELGELFEHQGQRYLAIKTWEQLRPAERVATRLRAELVVASTTTK